MVVGAVGWRSKALPFTLLLCAPPQVRARARTEIGNTGADSKAAHDDDEAAGDDDEAACNNDNEAVCNDDEAACDDDEAACDNNEAVCDDNEAACNDNEAACNDDEAACDDNNNCCCCCTRGMLVLTSGSCPNCQWPYYLSRIQWCSYCWLQWCSGNMCI
jgi:hypothetical protein